LNTYCILEIVDEFKDLGISLKFNGNFRKLQKRTVDQGRKALFALIEIWKNNYFNIETLLAVFDAYVRGVFKKFCK